MEETIYTIKEVAIKLKCSVQTIRNHYRSGLLKSVKIGGRRFIRLEDLRAYLGGKTDGK